MSGLLRIIPASQLDTVIPTDKIVDTVFESELTRHIRRHWETNRNAKLWVENALLEDLRGRNGEYHPSKLTQIRQQGGSEIYMMITATKQRAAASWIKDIILPQDEKAWGITPTPIAQLPQWAEQAVEKRIQQSGGGTTEFLQLRKILALEIQAQAKLSAENMTLKIEDQLTEGKWGKVINELIDDFCTFSACILKGPMLKKRKVLSWQSGFGTTTPSITTELKPEYERVSPFDIYPSPQSEDVNEQHLIEHIRFERGELYNMIDVPGYKNDQIRKVLEEYTEGLREWLWQDTERNENENKYHWWRDDHNGLIDGLHYWGSVQGSHLREWGISVPDELAEYQIDAILIGRYIIRCQINNDALARRPYMKACYDPIPGAFWGNSIRYLMNDIQELCNATARALVNNMAMASGPMVEVNYERLSPLETELEIFPWKIWQTRGAEVGQGPTLQFFQPQSNASELMAVYDRFELKADDATSIPRYSHGNEKVGGAGTTASGLSMLMNSAAKSIKAAIANFDYGVTRPAIEMLYYYNMLTSDDQSIKGDAQVVARGANALLLRDMAQQRRFEFMNLTANPLDMGIIGEEGRADILRAVAKDFDLEGIVPSRDVIRQRAQEKAENPPPNPEQIKAQAAERLEEIKQKGEAERMAIEGEFKEALKDIEKEKNAATHQARLAEINAKKDVDIDKQRRAEQSEIRLMQEETTRIIERAEINAEADLEKHALDLEQKDKELEIKESERKAKEADAESNPPAEPSKSSDRPLELTVVIDNKTGTVKKKIKVTRDKDKQMSELDVEETSS
jgi:hypothetical protein